MEHQEYDLICVGGGIMSATLALLCKILNPDINILIFERLSNVAQESSAAFNNAGTGHSALCELNYTPEDKKGNIDISQAVKICTQFEISKQFWSYLVDNGYIQDPTSFIKQVPHYSFVTGEKNAAYLKKRFNAMKEHFIFDSITFTKDIEIMKKWFPIIMQGRNKDDIVAASKIERGTELNFGSLAKQLYDILATRYNTQVVCNTEVTDITKCAENKWIITTKNTKESTRNHIKTTRVFIGAGGGSLNLLQKVNIPEKDGYGGFPVSGEWLICKNENIVKQHFAKVYSMAEVEAPPMSVPHLDTRYIDNKPKLLFGPFAGFSTKFLKQGSNLDLFKSIKTQNLGTLFGALKHNLPLTKYLIKQVTMSFKDKMNALRFFIKDAKDEDWELIVAGQRVQTITRDSEKGGKIEFGTEIVNSADGSITCLLGASPGASISVTAMMEVIEKIFPELLQSAESIKILEEMLPAWGKPLTAELFNNNLQASQASLKL